MFGLIREYGTWIAYGAAVLCALAFGVTGVVIQVFSPRENRQQESRVATFTILDEEGTEREMHAQRDFTRMAERWDTFFLSDFFLPLNEINGQTPYQFIQNQDGPQQGLMNLQSQLMRAAMMGNRLSRGGQRLRLRMQAFQQITREADVQFLDWVFMLTPESAPAGVNEEDVTLLNPLSREALDENSTRQETRYWKREIQFRLYFLYNLAREWGFGSNPDEADRVLQPLVDQLARAHQNQNQNNNNNGGGDVNFTMENLSTHLGFNNPAYLRQTVQEFLTILKFIGNISRGGGAGSLSLDEEFQKGKGYYNMLLAELTPDDFRDRVFNDAERHLKWIYLEGRPGNHRTHHYQTALDEQFSGSTVEGSDLEKRQFSYVMAPADAYRDTIEEPSEEDMRERYENEKDDRWVREDSGENGNNSEPNTGNDSETNPGVSEENEAGNEPDDTEETGDTGDNGETTEETNNEQGEQNGASTGEGEESDGDTSDGEGEDETEYVPFEEVRDDIRSEMIRDRTMRAAADAIRNLINNRIHAIMARPGETVNLQRLVEESDEPLEYRESPLMDRDGFDYWAEQMQEMEDTYVSNLREAVFEEEIDPEQGKGPVLEEAVWMKDGVILPRLIRVENDFLQPASPRMNHDQYTPIQPFGGVSPVYSLQFTPLIQNYRLQQSTRDRVQELQDQFKEAFQNRKETNLAHRSLMGPLVPYHVQATVDQRTTPEDGGSGTTGAESETGPTYGPDGALNGQLLDNHLVMKRMEWREVRQAFERTAVEHSSQANETGWFTRDNPPRQLYQDIRNRVQYSPGSSSEEETPELYEPLTAERNGQVQIGVIYRKMPPDPAKLESYLEEQRDQAMNEGQGEFVRQRLVDFFRQSEFTFQGNLNVPMRDPDGEADTSSDEESNEPPVEQ